MPMPEASRTPDTRSRKGVNPSSRITGSSPMVRSIRSTPESSSLPAKTATSSGSLRYLGTEVFDLR